MRWICYFFLLPLCSLTAIAADDPSEAALQFLRGLDEKSAQNGKPEGLAISPHCGPLKKQWIEKAWKVRSEWATEGAYQFSRIAALTDGEFSAVLIGAVSPKSPNRCHILPLGLLKKEESWKVAPVEGSFENVGVGFDQRVKRRLRVLETWMERERIPAIAALQQQEQEKFRNKMAGVVDEATLSEEDPEIVLQHFFKAAIEGQAEALLVWQGVLERDELPERDWELHLAATQAGMANQDLNRVWRLLTSNKVMLGVVPLDADSEEATFLVGFLSAYEVGHRDEQLNAVRFHLYRTTAGWRVFLPGFFSHANLERRAFSTAAREDSDWDDRNDVRKMFGLFEKENPALHDSEPKAVLEGLIGDSSKGDLTSFLRRHYRVGEKKDKEAKDDDAVGEAERLMKRRIRRLGGAGNPLDDRRLSIYTEAVKWWSASLKTRDQVTPKLEKIYQEGDLALAVLSYPGEDTSWKPNYQVTWLGKGDSGWMILPGTEAPLKGTFPEDAAEVVEQLNAKWAEGRRTMEKAFLEDVLKVVGIDQGHGEALSDRAGIALVQAWRKTAAKEDMMSLLKVSAVRRLPNRPKDLLRDLGFIRRGAMSGGAPDEVLGSKAVGRFLGVSLMIDDSGGKERACPLVLVVPTEKGPRVLVDIELPLEVNKGIRLLNDARLADLAEELSEEDLAAVKALREWHQGVAGPVWEKWKSEQE